MEFFYGSISLLAVATITLVLANQRPAISLILASAFLLRTGAALFHSYIAPLPDGTADAVTFESQAWQWAQGGLQEAIGQFAGLGADFYVWCLSLIYAFAGRSLLLLQSISVLAGVLGVLATWKLALELWGERAAFKAAWVMAIFPAVVQYAALPLREALVVLFLVCGLIGLVRWARRGGLKPTVLTLCSFGAATCFHGGLFIAILAFLGLMLLQSVRSWLAGVSQQRVRILAFLSLVLALGLVVVYIGSGYSLPKLGTAEQMVSPERWFYYFTSRVQGDAAYPLWTQPQTCVDFLWAVPLRAVYLMFSPFPWDLQKLVHGLGLADGLVYLGLTILVVRNAKAVVQDRGARVMLLVVLALILAFGVGTGNFGTAIRHRAKLVPAVIVLASPMLPSVRLRSLQRPSERQPA